MSKKQRPDQPETNAQEASNKVLFDELELLTREFLANLQSFHLQREEKNLEEILENLRQRQLSAIVVGEFSRGKSMFINSLLERDYLPTGITPTTSTIARIHYGEQEKITIICADEQPRDITYEEFVELNADDCRNVHHMDIELPNPILKRITFIDTPGVNDPDEHKVEILYDHIPSADVLILLLSCDQVFTRNERIFLAQKVMRHDLSKVLVVLNKTDILRNEKDKQILENRVQNELGKIVDFPQVVTYSAQSAVAGIQNNDTALLHESNFHTLQATLENVLNNSLLLESSHSKLSRILEQAHNHFRFGEVQSQKTNTELENEIAKLQENRKKLKAVIGKLEQGCFREIDDLGEQFVLDLKEFALHFRKVIPSQLNGIAQDDMQKYLPFFIQDVFKQFVEGKTEEIHARILAVIEDLFEKAGKEQKQRFAELKFIPDYFLASVEYLDALTRYEKIRVLFSTVGIGSLFVAAWPASALLMAFSGAMGLLFKGKTDKNFLDKISEQTQFAVMDAAKKIELKMQEFFKEVQQNVSSLLADIHDQSFQEIERTLTETLEKKSATEKEKINWQQQRQAFGRSFESLHKSLESFADKM